MTASVLCVDNDRDLVHIVSRALTCEGYRVLTAYDGQAAVETVREDAPDLVLLDLILPKRDGFQVLEAIRTLDGPGPSTPVVLLTGCSPSPAYRERAESLGAAALLTKPQPLDNLLGVVADHVAKPHAPARGAASPTLSGSLGTLPFPALLHHLHGLRAAGVLHLSNGRRRKWLELRDGYPVAVRSNMVSECFGNLLVRAGRITKSDLDESRRRMIAGKLQGEILVAMHLLDEEELPKVLRQQAEEKLFEIFSWRSGTFRFDVGGRLQQGNELRIDESPANLILRGVRDRFPLERIDGYLRSHRDALVGRCESPFYRFQEVELDPTAEELVLRLDGSRPLREFQDAGEGLRRTFYGLLATGLLELRGGGAPGASQIEAAPRFAAEAGDAGNRPQRLRSPDPPRREQRDDRELHEELTALAERLRGEDHFQVLGVRQEAPDDAVRSAYERLMAQAHPDRLKGASQSLKRLAGELRARFERAFETLSDPRLRGAYLLDRHRAERERKRRSEDQAVLDAELQAQYGEVALRQRDYPRALDCFQRAVELNPSAGEYHANLGWALHLDRPEDRGALAQAIRHAREGAKLARESEKPYLLMGRLLKAADRPDAAEKMFTRAVQITPECFEALRELRLIHMRREKSKGLVRRLLRR